MEIIQAPTSIAKTTNNNTHYSLDKPDIRFVPLRESINDN